MINKLIFSKSKACHQGAILQSLTLSYLMARHVQPRDQTTNKASTATLTTLQQKGSNRNTCKEINLSKLSIKAVWNNLHFNVTKSKCLFLNFDKLQHEASLI